MADAIPPTDDRFDQAALTLRSWIALGLGVIGVALTATNGDENPGWVHVAAIASAIAGLVLAGSAIARTPRNVLVIAAGGVTAHGAARGGRTGGRPRPHVARCRPARARP